MMRLRSVSGPRVAGAKTWGGGRAGGAWHGAYLCRRAGRPHIVAGQCPAVARGRQRARSQRRAADAAVTSYAPAVAAHGRRRARAGLRMVSAAMTPPAAQVTPEMSMAVRKPRGQLGGAQRGGTGQAGEQRQDGHGEEPGGPGHDVVDRRGDAGVLGRRGAHGRRGQRGDGRRPGRRRRAARRGTPGSNSCPGRWPG